MKWWFIILLVFSCSHDQSSHPKWSYAGQYAPYHWGEIQPEFIQCKQGDQQSPINLKRSLSRSIAQRVEFSYEDLSGNVRNTGHSIQLDFSQKAFVSIDSKKFYLRQMHFHAKSEHALEGRFFPAELHIVHESEDKELAVLGIFIELDDENFDHYGFFQSLPNTGETKEGANIKLSKIVSELKDHSYYRGSLTTPPCTENVHWLVFDYHLALSSQQLSRFESLYSNNYRPLQPLKNRGLFHTGGNQ